MSNIRIGQTHYDHEPHNVLKIRVNEITLKLTSSEARKLMQALIDNKQCEGYGDKEISWCADRRGIEVDKPIFARRYPGEDYADIVSIETHSLKFTDDWSSESWQYLAATCKAFVG